MQILGLLRGASLEWPPALAGFLGATGGASFVNPTLLVLECAWAASPARAFQRVFVFLGIPVGIWVCTALAAAGYHQWHRRRQSLTDEKWAAFKRHGIVLGLIVLFFLHPSISVYVACRL